MIMRARGPLLALALLAAFAPDSWGQSKQPSQPQTQPAQQQAAPDQRGTENSPVVVKVLPAQENKEKSEAEAREHNEKRQFDTDTLWLTEITVALIFLQADAADLSAKAVTIVEFPIIRTLWIGPTLLTVDYGLIDLGRTGEDYVGVVNDGPPTKFSIIKEIEYRNYGRSPAFPIQMHIGYTAAKALPDIPVYKKTATSSPSSILKEREESGKIQIDFGFELTESERIAIAKSESVLWFYVLMTYLDIMDRPHEIGSCWQWGKQNPADSVMYFFDNGTAPAAYTKRT